MLMRAGESMTAVSEQQLFTAHTPDRAIAASTEDGSISTVPAPSMEEDFL
jgi:hypothetical protein